MFDEEGLQHEITEARTNAEHILGIAMRPITTATEYESGAQWRSDIRAKERALEEREKEITRPINASLKSIRDLFRGPRDVLAKARMGLDERLRVYLRAEEEKRVAAQRAAEEAARKERERLERQARAAEAKGKVEQAEAKREVAAAVVAPVVPMAVPQVSGSSVRKSWKPEITDEAKIPREYLVVDMVKLRKVVRALGPDANIPGVRAVEEISIASRAFA